jgi:hypothetical protein
MIKVKIDGKTTSFSIKDIAGVQIESFINPVTREEKTQKYNCQMNSYRKLQKQPRRRQCAF